jgi:hypothetical protein
MMIEMTRAQECIEMLKILQAEIEWQNTENLTVIKNVKPDSVHFVLEQAINLLNKYDPDWAKDIRGMEG